MTIAKAQRGDRIRPTASERNKKKNMKMDDVEPPRTKQGQYPTKKKGRKFTFASVEYEEMPLHHSPILTEVQPTTETTCTKVIEVEEVRLEEATLFIPGGRQRPTASEGKRNMPIEPTRKERKKKQVQNSEVEEQVVTCSPTLPQMQRSLRSKVTEVDVPVNLSGLEGGERKGKKSKVVSLERQEEVHVPHSPIAPQSQASLDTTLPVFAEGEVEIAVDIQSDHLLETPTQPHIRPCTHRRCTRPTEPSSEPHCSGENPLGTPTQRHTRAHSHGRRTSLTEPSDEPEVVIGPQDRSLLKSFQNHVAASIWQGQERGLLKLHCHSNIVKKWVVCDRVKERIRHSGLLPLCEGLTYMYSNRVLVSAFVERWHPETNSFHFGFGEMGITLDDVVQLTGLQVTGLVVHADENMGRDEYLSLIETTLGARKADADMFLDGSGIPFEWLRLGFSEVLNDTCSDWWVDCCARAYLLYVLGSTIFVDKTGVKVNVCYLGLLADLDRVGSYAFGAAALAYLYRQLGHASRSGVRQMSGYITLLEAWILEHFPILQQGRSDPRYTEEMPRARRWLPHKEVNTETTIRYREMLDDLVAERVIFDPYKDRRVVVPEIALYTGPIRCMGIVEPYLPDRVLRQFGFVQLLPGRPIGPERGSKRGSVPADYVVVYTWTDGYWGNWNYHVLPEGKRVVVKEGVPWEVAPDYLQWFRRVSHFRVAPHRGDWQQGGGLAERHATALDLLQRALGSVGTCSDHRHTLVKLERILRGEMEDVVESTTTGTT